MEARGSWRLGHRPALDGIRGVAVLLVLATHLRVPGFGAAPAVGVAIFFTLSGFLITSLLLERNEPLRHFYLRRTARLAPALLACVALYVVLQLALTGRVGDRGLIVGALTYSGNWIQATGNYDPASGIGHLWSLAIEEQFYLLWPIALLLVQRLRRGQVVVLVAACTVSVVLRFSYYADIGYHRAYYGLDSRADELLIGCALALWMSRRHEVRAPSWLAPAALGSAVALSWSPPLFAHLLLPTLTALLAAFAAFGSVNGPTLRWPTGRWLTWVGRRSYGVYLYHLPLRWAVERSEMPWWCAAPIVFTATLLIAEMSWRLLEKPVLTRSRAWLDGAVVDGPHLQWKVSGGEEHPCRRIDFRVVQPK